MAERLPDAEQERLAMRLPELDELIHVAEQAFKATGRKQPSHDALVKERDEIHLKLHGASGDD